jgi:uncharacterized protein with von Willebrand factor type A (vWA) domain
MEGAGVGDPVALVPKGKRLDEALEFLYGREYGRRGVRSDSRSGGSGESAPEVPRWIGQVRELFPKETVELVERHALARYGLVELVTDPGTLRRLEPSIDLLRAILVLKERMSGNVLPLAREVVRKVVDDIVRRLRREIQVVFGSRLDRRRRSGRRGGRLDPLRTIRANLGRWNREERRLEVDRLVFTGRDERLLGWELLVAVDQSGSMVDSVIHSAVAAGVLASIPGLSVRLFAFDTSLVELTGQLSEPVELLMGVQLGGGTDIGGAVAALEGMIRNPRRTAVIFVTDFYEGGSPASLVAAIRRIREDGARVLGLAALDSKADPAFDRELADRCVEAGAEVAALTPGGLAEWLAKNLS